MGVLYLGLCLMKNFKCKMKFMLNNHFQVFFSPLQLKTYKCMHNTCMFRSSTIASALNKLYYFFLFIMTNFCVPEFLPVQIFVISYNLDGSAQIWKWKNCKILCRPVSFSVTHILLTDWETVESLSVFTVKRNIWSFSISHSHNFSLYQHLEQIVLSSESFLCLWIELLTTKCIVLA